MQYGPFKLPLCAILRFVFFTTFLFSQVPQYQWSRVIEHAPFSGSYNFQMFSIRDTLRVIHSEGTWFSVDGKKWNHSPLSNIVTNQGFLDYVFFKGSLFGLGTFAGNIEHFTQTTAIHVTTDMKNWKLLANESSLPKRFFYHPFVFKDKIWIIGGSDGTQEFSDAWNSADGVHWKKIAESLPFGRRQNCQFVHFKGKLFMLSNDVWSSTDGIRWTIECERLANEEISGYTTVVYDDKIWLLGCSRNNVFKSEILVSADGKTWIPQRAPWSPRGGAAACVYNGKIFMTGGKYGGFNNGQTEFVYSNDVWMMGKK